MNVVTLLFYLSSLKYASAYTAETAFGLRSLLDKEGLKSIPTLDVPAHYVTEDEKLMFPKHWFPSKVKTRKEYDELHEYMEREAAQHGIFTIPIMEKVFKELDPAYFAGKTSILPTVSDMNGYHVHQYILLFAMSEELLERDVPKGKASMRNLIRMVEKIREEDIRKAFRVVFEADVDFDAPFMSYWFNHFMTVKDKTHEESFERYSRIFINWCNSIIDEFDYLGKLYVDENYIEDMWECRILTLGGWVICDGILLANEIHFDHHISNEIYEEFDAMQHTWSHVCRIINEVVSAPKDVEDAVGSIFTCTMIRYNLSYDEAVKQFVTRFHDAVAKLDEQCDAMLEKYPDDAKVLDSTFKAWRYYLLGLIEWHVQVCEEPKRYTTHRIVNPGKEIVKKLTIVYPPGHSPDIV